MSVSQNSCLEIVTPGIETFCFLYHTIKKSLPLTTKGGSFLIFLLVLFATTCLSPVAFS